MPALLFWINKPRKFYSRAASLFFPLLLLLLLFFPPRCSMQVFSLPSLPPVSVCGGRWLCSVYGGPVLIKFNAEASLELWVEGEAYVNGSPWKQRLLIKDAAGRCPSNPATTAKRVIRHSDIAGMLPNENTSSRRNPASFTITPFCSFLFFDSLIN